jgi:hypothetical protein
MTSSTSSSRPASFLAAVVLPLLVLGGGYTLFSHRDPGKLSPAAEKMNERLFAAPPDVVVLGNSLAAQSIDTTMLLEGLAMGNASCQVLDVSQSRPPTWYAVLENRVYGNAYKPRLVLVIGLLETMFSTDPGSTASVLGDYLEPDDAVIQRKTLGADVGPLFLYPLRVRRDQLKTAFLAGIRDLVVGVFAGGDQGSLLERGQAVAGPALARVFSAGETIDMANWDRAIPIVEERKAGVKDDQSSLEDSYVPDLVDLATSHGARIVFVQVPLSSAMSSRPRLANVEHDLIEYLNSRGAGWLDLSQIGVPDSGFADQAHLNGTGRKQFTAALAERLLAMGATSGASLAKAMVPLRPSHAERSGQAPVLPVVGPRLAVTDLPCTWRSLLSPPLPFDDYSLTTANVGMISPVEFLEDGKPLQPHGKAEELKGECLGIFNIHGEWIRFVPTTREPDPSSRSYQAVLSKQFPMVTAKGEQVWWIYPGTTGRFVVNEPWTGERGPFSLDATVMRFGETELPVTLGLAGEDPIPFQGVSTLARAVFEGDAPQGSTWAIEIASPKEGPYALLSSLSAGQGELQSNLVGHATGGKGQSVVLVGTPKLPFDFSFDGDPPMLEPAPIIQRQKSFSFAVPKWDFLVSSNVHKATDAQGCDPTWLFVDGDPFPVARSGCEGPKAATSASWCHAPGFVWFSLPEGRDPRSDGHTYRLGLDPTRKCNNYRMIYPGDTLRATQKKKSFLVGADHLDLRGHLMPGSGPDKPLHIRVEASGKVVLDKSVDMAATTSGLGFDFDTRVDPDDNSLTIAISSPPDAAYYLLVSLAVSEERPFDDLPRAAGPAFDLAGGSR